MYLNQSRNGSDKMIKKQTLREIDVNDDDM